MRREGIRGREVGGLWKASCSDLALGLAGWADLLTREKLAQIDMGRQGDCHVHPLKSLSLTEVFWWSHEM